MSLQSMPCVAGSVWAPRSAAAVSFYSERLVANLQQAMAVLLLAGGRGKERCLEVSDKALPAQCSQHSAQLQHGSCMAARCSRAAVRCSSSVLSGGVAGIYSQPQNHSWKGPIRMDRSSSWADRTPPKNWGLIRPSQTPFKLWWLWCCYRKAHSSSYFPTSFRNTLFFPPFAAEGAQSSSIPYRLAAKLQFSHSAGAVAVAEGRCASSHTGLPETTDQKKLRKSRFPPFVNQLPDKGRTGKPCGRACAPPAKARAPCQAVRMRSRCHRRPFLRLRGGARTERRRAVGLRCEGGNGGRGAGGAGGRFRRDADGERGYVSSSGRPRGPRLVEPILGPSLGRSGGQRHAQPERQEAARLPAGQRRQPRPERHHPRRWETRRDGMGRDGRVAAPRSAVPGPAPRGGGALWGRGTPGPR